MINQDLLLRYGGQIKSYESGENILNEGEIAKYFFQVVSGQVKMEKSTFKVSFRREKVLVNLLFSENSSVRPMLLL